MKRIIIALIIIMVFFTVTWAQMRGMMRGGMHDISPISPIQYQQERFSEEMHISRGGQLYDDWWRTTVDTVKPGKDHPLWKMPNVLITAHYAGMFPRYNADAEAIFLDNLRRFIAGEELLGAMNREEGY